MAAPLVSVITPHLPERAQQLDRCACSVLSQWYPSVEHVIVTHDPDRFKGNFGGEQRNEGLLRAGGEYIAYLDDDDAFRPWHLSLLVGLLEAERCAGWAYAAVDWHRGTDVRRTYAVPPRADHVSSIFVHRASQPVTWHDGPREDWDVVAQLMRVSPFATVDVVTADAYSSERS